MYARKHVFVRACLYACVRRHAACAGEAPDKHVCASVSVCMCARHAIITASRIRVCAEDEDEEEKDDDDEEEEAEADEDVR